jgi:hypothetical protein
MNKRIHFACLAPLLFAGAMCANADTSDPVQLRAPGVLCDRYMCADDKGVSPSLTQRYLGKAAAAKLVSQGGFSPTEFTFANGVFCDVKERVCRTDRYFDAKGKRSGEVLETYTTQLFGR